MSIESQKILNSLKNSENKTWCPVPWISCSTATNGQYRLCVQAKSDRSTRGLFYNQENSPLLASTTSLRESRNSNLAKEVRQFMLKGQNHPACVRCLTEETSGLLSRRAMDRFNYSTVQDKIHLQDCLDKTSNDGTIDHEDFPVYDLDLRMGNRCNLKCRSCNPSESSAWYQEWFDTRSKKFNVETEKINLSCSNNGNIVADSNNLNWGKNSVLINNFEDDTPELTQLAIVGGEPLLIEEHFEALGKLVDNGQSKKIILSYNINATIIPQRIISVWEHFKEVKIGYSIDGVGRVNDYIRYPSKWSQITQNIKKIISLKGNISCWPTVTIMAYNILYVPEIIIWQLESGLSNKNTHPMNLFLVQHPLRYPIELSAQVLPLDVKKAIENKFIKFKNEWFKNYLIESVDPDLHESWKNRLEYILSSVLNQLFEQDLNLHYNDFLLRTKQMDEYRQQSIQQSLPELAILLGL